VNTALRTLASSARDEVAHHLLQLSAEDRRLRFGAPLSDAAIRGYADALNFARDKLFGVFEDGALVGVAHLALQSHGAAAELGVSVSPGSRCRGYAYALLCISAQHARRVACRQLDMRCLAENHVMVHLARKAGMIVISGLGRAGAYIALGGEPAGQPVQSLAQRSPTGRKPRAVLVAALMPAFGLAMALMVAVGTACDSCKPQPLALSQCAVSPGPGCAPTR
jgi:RimJ/RimL family protein N-acetyltransferase